MNCQRMLLILIVALRWYTFVDSQQKVYHWILYSNAEKMLDCFLTIDRYFCRSTRHVTAESKSNESCVDGTPWTFLELKDSQVTTDELVDWFIPFDLIEQYAEYLNFSPLHHTARAIICNCSATRIGLKCEYEIKSRSAGVLELIRALSDAARSTSEAITSTFVDGIVCYTDALGLDWGQVCDGIVDCQNGVDELDCHLLESHQCDVDEIQCRNGMCVPKEFLFDASIDCMDSSDEQEIALHQEFYAECPAMSTLECDERLCQKHEYSCGDGTCIPWTTRISHAVGCANAREAAYRCETVDALFSIHPDWGVFCYRTTLPKQSVTNTSDCITSLRYLLAANRWNPTKELRQISYENILSRCPEFIQYPQQAVRSPVLTIHYKKSVIETFYQNGLNFHRQMPRKPHLFCLNGSMMCHGIWMTLRSNYCLNQNEFQKLLAYPFFPIPHLFCQIAEKQHYSDRNQTTITNTSDQWNGFRSYSCRNTTDRIAFRRVNDGYADCLFGDDESNGLYIPDEPFRYKCQTESLARQYVSYQQLGNGIKECGDGSDEVARDFRWSFFKCDANDNYACWVFRGDGMTENRVKDVQLSFQRYCDSVWDTMDGKDERDCTQWICTQGTSPCHGTGQCIDSTYFCDGEFDCDDGEDELNCSLGARRWTLESSCNNKSEHFCITEDYVANQTSARPCIPYSQAGDGKMDCIGGRDERNVFACSDHLPLGDRFLCDNQTKCLDHTALCNGFDDCLDRTDERICFWNRTRCEAGQFACPYSRKCISNRCDPKDSCPNKASWFWCPNSPGTTPVYRSSKYERISDYDRSCYKNTAPRTLSPGTTAISFAADNRPQAPVPPKYGFCNKGFYIITNNGLAHHCFCPPNQYGEQCQYSSRRVTIRIRFDRFHRSEIPAVLTVLVSLVYNKSDIIDHHFFLDAVADYPPKMNRYLVYPRPKIPGRYSVRFEAYNSMALLAAWEYSITPLDFLPAFRLAKILRFPERPLPWLCSANPCQNNGTCHMMNDGQHLCLCQRGWKGIFCEQSLKNIRCAPHSLARDQHVCICPYGYIEPHCFVRNTVCERSHSCAENEVCYSGSHQPPNWYRCACNASTCDSRKTVISVHRQESNSLPFLLQLLKISSDYPRVRQQILLHPSTIFPVTTTIKTRDIRKIQGALPEIGLLFTFQPRFESIDVDLHLLFINCSTSLRNYTVDLDVQPQRCRPVNKREFPSVTYLRGFCQNSSQDSCFHTDGYICYCNSSMTRQSECISYHQRHTTCTHCLNKGYCVQGGLTDRNDFACVCPKCVSGELCQFAAGRFSISLEYLVEKANWKRYHYIGPTIFSFVGLIFNSLCLITFRHRKLREKNICFYLFLNSIVSQCVLICLLIRILYLTLARQLVVREEINRGLCKSLPYLMPSLYYISLWLMTFVTVQRAIVAAFPTKFFVLRSLKSSLIFIFILSSIIFGSNYIYIDQYKIVRDPDDLYPWCINEVKPSQKHLLQYLSLAHQIVPFLTNIVAGLVIILIISRSKANSHHLQKRNTLVQQLRKRIDLLLGPTICFITQIPQFIVVFLDICDYESSSWFIHMIIIAYYISFAPQISLFFLYLLPSSLYRKTLFKETNIGNQLIKLIPSLSPLAK